VSPRALLTCRAGIEACRQVGELARPVSGVADELGVCWWTVMHAVERHGRPLVDDPARVGPVVALGVDETSFLKATLVAIGAALGIPIGIVLGRLLWGLFARAMNAVPAPTVAVGSIVLIGVAAIVLANAVAAVPARVAARTPTALLRSE